MTGTRKAKQGARTGQGVKPIILPFTDDSTLIFACRMRNLMRSHPAAPPIEMAWMSDDNALSYRQMAQLLPEGPDRVLRRGDIAKLVSSRDVEAILTSRVYRPLGDALKKKLIKYRSGRACVIAFLGGLDFFPEVGFERRRHCDGVYLFPRSELPRFRNWGATMDRGWQELGFGHPSFLHPDAVAAETTEDTDRRDIYFFAQALSPSTKRGRLHMLRALAAMARAHPDRRVWIKLRHLPSENRSHLHREKYDYPGLMAALPECPDNLKLTAESMDEALSKAALGITCTSTAAVDVVRARVPCMVHLDFVDAYCDPLVEPMRRLFAQSALITGLEDMLNLRAKNPNPDWLDDMFSTLSLADDVLNTIARFRDRPFQIP